MKFLTLGFLLLFTANVVHAAYSEEPVSLNSSSFTTTNEGPVRLGLSKAGDILVGVLVSSASSATGASITLYDSQGTATNKLQVIDLTGKLYNPFDVRLSSGVSYTTAGNGAGVMIIYRVR